MHMNNIKIFNNFAAAFELAVKDNNWLRLEEYLAEDASYVNVGGPDPKLEGRNAVIRFLKDDVGNTDKRFDTRTLIALTQPKTDGDRLSRQWRCTYTLEGAPDLVVEGEARYRFENNLIKEIEENVTKNSMKKSRMWMESHGEKLHA